MRRARLDELRSQRDELTSESGVEVAAVEKTGEPVGRGKVLHALVNDGVLEHHRRLIAVDPKKPELARGERFPLPGQEKSPGHALLSPERHREKARSGGRALLRVENGHSGAPLHADRERLFARAQDPGGPGRRLEGEAASEELLPMALGDHDREMLLAFLAETDCAGLELRDVPGIVDHLVEKLGETRRRREALARLEQTLELELFHLLLRLLPEERLGLLHLLRHRAKELAAVGIEMRRRLVVHDENPRRLVPDAYGDGHHGQRQSPTSGSREAARRTIATSRSDRITSARIEPAERKPPALESVLRTRAEAHPERALVRGYLQEHRVRRLGSRSSPEREAARGGFRASGGARRAAPCARPRSEARLASSSSGPASCFSPASSRSSRSSALSARSRSARSM